MSNNKPKLRFKEYNGSWRVIALGDNFSKITEKNKNNIINNVISNSAKHGLVRQTDYFKKDIANEDNTDGYYVVKENDFVYNSRKSEDSPYGPIKVYTYRDDGIVSPLYLCFRSKENSNVDFFVNYFASPKWHKYLHINGDLGARLGRVSIKDKDFFKMPISTPDESEQKKIAEFLSKIDEKIALQSKKVEELEKLKRGLIQKIFARELRFKDENGKVFGEWDETEIQNICKIMTGSSNTQDKVEGGTYPFYVRSPIIERSTRYLYDEEAVLTVGDGVGTGKVYHYVNGKFDLHQRVYKMSDFNGVIAKYFYYYFSSHFYNRVKRLTAKNSVDSVRMDMIAKMKIYLPSLPEQKKIAEFLSKFDERIEIEAEILERWKKVKKGLLQQMFV